ncbi:hypothetical protein A5904_05645 [Acidithiobacillus caldus]|uniref:hypothetical protein n=1 Tax=Acidithiobacillus caldus TaxID=33059 RepID=UPI0007DA0A4B|nr:hypothetical protein [Acidithiobacillus caldus]AUW32515.1 hypothetical protein A5904_05645 [Acidithiobacillus caldus]QER44952.1 hypothetical protein F0726_01892 [Acidithiobacillus caldus]
MNPVTMIFIAIVVVVFVIAGVAAGIFLLHGSESSAFAQDVTTIQGAVGSVFGVQGNYSGVSTSGVIPKSLQGSTPVGGTFAVASGSAGLPSYEYQIEANNINISPSICRQIVSQVDTVSTLVNGSAVGNSNATPTGAQASSACANGATSLAFVFSNDQ